MVLINLGSMGFSAEHAGSVWNPCRCLCFGLALQTMYSFPLRLTTLQESQSFLMAERTRMALQALCNSDVHPSYFAADDPSRGRC